MNELGQITKAQELNLGIQKQLSEYKLKKPGDVKSIDRIQAEIDKLNSLCQEMTGKILDHETFKNQLREKEEYIKILLSKLNDAK